MGNVAPKFTRECCSPSFAVEREPANASSSASASPASRSAAYPTTPQRYGTIVMQEFSMSTPRGSDMKAEASIMRLAEAFERDKHEAETMHEEEKLALHKRLAALEHELASVASTTPSPTPTPNVHVSFCHTNLLLWFTTRIVPNAHLASAHHSVSNAFKCPPCPECVRPFLLSRPDYVRTPRLRPPHSCAGQQSLKHEGDGDRQRRLRFSSVVEPVRTLYHPDAWCLVSNALYHPVAGRIVLGPKRVRSLALTALLPLAL